MKDFSQLISTIEQVHQHLQAKAANAVNQALTIRNWLIGYYIVEFEQEGKDRAEYGAKLLATLADELKHIKGWDERAFRRFRQFYLTYTHLEDIITAKQKWGTLSPGLPVKRIRGSLSPEFTHAQNSPPKHLQVPPEKLLSALAYSHLELLINITEPLKRTFYEIECIKGTWSVRELKR